MTIYTKFGKPTLDFSLACVLAPLALAVTAITGAVVKTADGGPALYRSHRLGRYGEPFQMLKLRSMTHAAADVRNRDGSTLTSENDPRVTPIGRIIRRTSLDELPQIANILRGDMSFVGPRPDLVDQRQYYSEEEAKKLDVRPGLTGLSQAFYRNSVPWSERLALDVYYAENVSLRLDCAIIAQTVRALLTRKGRNLIHQQVPGSVS